MTKHTPGPWIIPSDSRTLIRTTRGLGVADTYGNTIIPEEQAANASLIAAAPDLLLAAKEAAVTLANMVEAVRGDPRRSPCINRLIAAVAKAEGR